MTDGQGLQLFGVVMLSVTICALWLNITMLTVDQGSPVLTAVLGLFVGIGGYVVGEVRRTDAE